MIDTLITDDARAWECFMVALAHLNILALLAWSDVPYSSIASKITHNSKFLPK